MAGKDGGKNSKYGRNTRSPSAKQQRSRTDRNKAAKRAASGALHVCPIKNDPARDVNGKWRWAMVRFGARSERVYCA